MEVRLYFANQAWRKIEYSRSISPQIPYYFRLYNIQSQVPDHDRATILVTNLETLVWFSPSQMLIWVLQSSQCSNVRVAQHWGRKGAHLSENKGGKSECKKFRENSRKTASVSTICDEYCRLWYTGRVHSSGSARVLGYTVYWGV